MLTFLYHAVYAVYAALRDALYDAIGNVTKLFAPTTTTARVTALFPRITPTAMPTPTPMPTLTPTPTPTPTLSTDSTTQPNQATDIAAAPRTPTMPSVPLSIADAMQSISTRWLPETPNVPDVEYAGFMTVYDDLLLPPALMGWSPASLANRLRRYTLSGELQSRMAQRRIRIAVHRRQTEPPLHDSNTFTMYDCGCGWCPNGIAAYPLCAAVTIRRTMRRFGARATQSVAGAVSHRQNRCGHRDPMAVYGRMRI